MKQMVRLSCAILVAAALSGCNLPTYTKQVPSTTAQAGNKASADLGKLQQTATGQLGDDPRQLAVHVYGKPPRGLGDMTDLLTLQVRTVTAAGTTDQVLFSTPISGTNAERLELVDFAGDGKPFVVVHVKLEAVSDYSAAAVVYKWDGQVLKRVFAESAWFGRTYVQSSGGQPRLVIYRHFEPPYSEKYAPVDLLCKPCPKLHGTWEYGWQNGALRVVDHHETSHAYSLYGNDPPEQPVTPEAQALYKRGEALVAAGHAQEALQPLQGAIALIPDYSDAHNDLAAAYAQLRDWVRSRDEAAKVVKWNPWNAHAQYNLGLAELTLEHFPAAEKAFWVACALEEDRWEPHYGLGQAYEHQGQKPKAIQEYRRALEIEPANMAAQTALARLDPRGSATVTTKVLREADLVLGGFVLRQSTRDDVVAKVGKWSQQQYLNGAGWDLYKFATAGLGISTEGQPSFQVFQLYLGPGSNLQTSRGVGVGSTVDAVLAAYGTVPSTREAGAGVLVYHLPANERLQIAFRIAEGSVQQIAVGDEPFLWDAFR